MDDCKNANTGMVSRRLFMTNNSVVDMIGHLHCDVFNQEKLLLNGVEVRERLVRSRDSFALMDPTDSYSSIRIDEANLIVRKDGPGRFPEILLHLAGYVQYVLNPLQ
ncbi:unnamed protein product, partial [Trichogramma brassicae]